MLTALALFLVGQTPVRIPLGPTLAPGVRPEFSQACIAVEDQLEKGEFDKAAAVSALLPKKIVTVEWNDAKVPLSRRKEFADARDAALNEWTKSLGGDFEFRMRPSGGDIRFNFEPVLAENPGSGLPAGAALFFSDSAKDPRLEVVIGLSRGKPAVQTDGNNVRNEVAHAAGAYYGLATTPFSGSVMGRTDLAVAFALPTAITEFGTAKANSRSVAVLLDAIKKKTKLAATRPQMSVDPKVVEQGPVLQGEKVQFTIAITNNGDSPLVYRANPDCGCIATIPGNHTVDAGSTDLLKVLADTSEFAGVLSKHMMIYSNDPEQPIRQVPIQITASPRYRFLSTSPQTMIVPEGGATFDVFLVTPENKPLEIAAVAISGIEGKVTQSAWKGNLPDPELNEAERPRVGTKFHVELQEQMLDGRAPVTLVVRTKDPGFPELRYNAYVQKGIVVLPDRISLGEIGKDVRKAMAIVSRPGQPFKILSAEADSKTLKVEVKPTRGEWEYQVTVIYNGQAPPGDFASRITLKTDDPRQPKLSATVRGHVR